MLRQSSYALKLVLVAMWFFLGAGTVCEATCGIAKHPVSLVEADIYVTKKKLVMRLTCFAEDLELLQGVEPYEDGKYDNTELEEGTADHAKYLLEKILILNADGEQLEGKITEIKGFEIPDEGIKAGDLMNYNMGYVIEYAYDKAPGFITVEQEMVADGALLPTELKILMKQAGSDVPYTHMMKPDQPETFRFDWENQPLARDASDEDWQAWFADQREKNLGIESYSSLYSFIYITKREVRQEVLIPIASLATFIDIESRDGRFLEIDEQDAVVGKIKALFSAANPVRVDQRVARPTFDRIDFYGLDIRDFAMQAQRRKISIANGRVGIIMSYFSGGSPSNVSVTWDMFNEVIRSVDVVVLEFDEVRRTQFSKFLPNNTFTWSNAEPEDVESIGTIPADFHLPVWAGFPWLSVFLFAGAICAFASGRLDHAKGQRYVVAGILTTAAILLIPLVKIDLYAPGARPLQIAGPQADTIFDSLHANLFRAFDYAEESKIYDGLSKSIDGPLLSELYLDLNDSLRIKEQGGAVAIITDVELLKGNLLADEKRFPTDEPGFVYRCKWNLVGNIEHWGHIHERTNTYDANFDVQAIDNEWKITEMRMNDAPQGFTRQKVRKF